MDLEKPTAFSFLRCDSFLVGVTRRVLPPPSHPPPCLLESPFDGRLKKYTRHSALSTVARSLTREASLKKDRAGGRKEGRENRREKNFIIQLYGTKRSGSWNDAVRTL